MVKKIILAFLICLTIIVIAGSFVYFRSIPAPEDPLTEDDKAALVYDRALKALDAGDEDTAIENFSAVARMFHDSPYAEASLRELADLSLQRGEKPEAAFYYQWLLRSFPDTDNPDEIRSRIEALSMKELLDPETGRGTVEYVVEPGDSLYAIAKKFNTTIPLIKKMNGLNTDTIRLGQKLKINTAEFSIFVDKSDNILILKKGDEEFKTYSVATGKDNCTPVGEVTIVEKMVKPVWTKPGVGLVMPDSEEYELGERWLAFSVQGYGIHGTNDESSIGKQSTAGCVRMRNEDVIELYDLVPVGTKVEIKD